MHEKLRELGATLQPHVDSSVHVAAGWHDSALSLANFIQFNYTILIFESSG